MTDDEINAVVRQTWGNGWMLPGEPQRMLVRAGYYAGMRRAAEIAREHEFARTVAAAIERAAGGEG